MFKSRSQKYKFSQNQGALKPKKSPELCFNRLGDFLSPPFGGGNEGGAYSTTTFRTIPSPDLTK